MKPVLYLSAVFGLGLGASVEVAGILYADGILMHNVYGFVGGGLIILGIIALGRGRARQNRQEISATSRE